MKKSYSQKFLLTVNFLVDNFVWGCLSNFFCLFFKQVLWFWYQLRMSKRPKEIPVFVVYFFVLFFLHTQISNATGNISEICCFFPGYFDDLNICENKICFSKTFPNLFEKFVHGLHCLKTFWCF